MRVHHMIISMLLCTVLVVPALAQEEQPMDSAQMADMIAKLTMLHEPGPEHALLEKMVGSWDMKITMWMSPDAEQPMVTDAQTTNRMMLGGRFLVAESAGGEGYMRIESFGVLGFDRRSGEYTSVGYDNMGTYYVAAKGTYDEDRSTIVMHGEDYDAALDHTQIWDQVITLVSDDEYRVEIIFLDEMHTQGKGPFKMVDITYHRVTAE